MGWRDSLDAVCSKYRAMSFLPAAVLSFMACSYGFKYLQDRSFDKNYLRRAKRIEATMALTQEDEVDLDDPNQQTDPEHENDLISFIAICDFMKQNGLKKGIGRAISKDILIKLK